MGNLWKEIIMTTEIRTCSKCSKEIEFGMAYEFIAGMCGPCFTWNKMRQDDEGSKKEALDKRMDKWPEICPKTYRDNDTNLIDDNAFKKVTGYRLSPRGVLCMGDSRSGKTTTCWRLIETLYVLHGIGFIALTESEFSQETAKAQRNRNLDKWLHDLCMTKILFLDDIGHVQATRSHLEELYYVVEKRTAWKKPIIATTQFSPNELIERSKGSAGEKTVIAILNRLRSHCEIVNF